jgi:hypothetical protein
MTRSSVIRWGTVAAVAAAGCAITTTHGDVGWDGMWVLQVVSRLHAGDTLYRDVFAGVPPLAFFTAWAATLVLGLELFTLRLVLIGVLALSYLVSADLVWRVTRTRRYDVVVGSMTLVWALPANVPLYQPLANLCLLAAVDAIAWWSVQPERGQRHDALPLWMAGAAAGLSFVSKQTTGAYALLVVLAGVALEHRRRRSSFLAGASGLGISGIAFALTVTVALVPVMAGGGWEKFLDYAFLGKSTYLRVGGVPFLDELATFLGSLRPGVSFNLLAFVRHQAFILPLLLVPAVVVLVRPRWRAEPGVGLLVCLALAEAATLYPRADIDHVVPAVPGMLVALLAAWHLGAWHPGASRLTVAWRRLPEAACVLLVAAGVVIRLGASVSALAAEDRVWCDLPHLRHVLLPRARAAELGAQARALRGASPSGRLFLLVPNAGLYYLVSGLTNPTPFDYPLATAFGRTGEAELARSIADGRLRQICMAPAAGLMAPARLQQAVRTDLSATADLGACVLYSARR